MQSEEMLALGRSYGIPVLSGWAGEEKPVKDTESKVPECESAKAKGKQKCFKPKGALNNVNTAKQ